ncbi:MAG: UvrD-helicase domain-containing protein [Bacteroidetes bacterium]|nr:UvrD-helicase domain-containing protein [Bacteroidota bacterium]
MKNKINKLTKQQQDATQIGFNVSLSANAGAGKTAVLVERYINLLSNGVNVNEIVAITFTKKAANEMIERVSDKLDDLIQNVPQDKKRHYKDMRKQLVTANISTIHSFCTAILRDYVIESGLDANFKEMSAFTRYNLVEDAIDITLEEIIANSEFSDLLFTYYKRKEIIEILKMIISKPDLVKTLERVDRYSFEEWSERIMLLFYEQTLDNVIGFIEYLEMTFGSFYEVQFKTEHQEYARYTIEKILKYKEIFDAEGTIKNYEEVVLLILECCQIKHTKGLYFIPALFKKYFSKEELETFNPSDYRKELIAKLNIITQQKFDNIHFELNKIIFAIYKKNQAEIDNIKKSLNEIDFDDMLIKTRDLLANYPDIAFAIASKYKEIMVDEFQDTNEIQYDIIKALVPTIDKNRHISIEDATKYPNVFIVGDVKQSIYKFRNADVEVFKKAISNIEESNKNYFYYKSKKYQCGSLALTTTFRTLPVVTGFINKVFNELGLYKKSEDDLVCGRELISEIIEGQHLDKQYGSVNFLIAVQDYGNKNNDAESQEENETNNENNSEEPEKEAHIIAQNIINIVNNKNYSYKDIAILYRARTNIHKLKKVFNANNIPYIETQGRSLWKNVEIQHILNYLNFINMPDNDLYCIGTLVSPFFSFTDSELLTIKSTHNSSIWENLKNNRKYNHITSVLNEHINLASNISIPHLINIILTNKNWIDRLQLLTEQGKELALKNIELFIGKTREFQTRGYVSLNDFLLEVNIQQELDILDADATLQDANTDAVRLLTIHSAKGLEFPNVILYDMSAKAKALDSLFINKKNGLSFKVPDTDKWNKQEDSFANCVIRNDEKMLEAEENLRLLYVAMTRAKDHLYISGTIKQAFDKKNKIYKASHNYQNSNFAQIINALAYDFESFRKLVIGKQAE